MRGFDPRGHHCFRTRGRTAVSLDGGGARRRRCRRRSGNGKNRKREKADSRRWKGQARNLTIDAEDLRLSVAARDAVRARAVVFAWRVRRRRTRIAFADNGPERRRVRLSARGDGRNASGLQQDRNEKNEPNEHGLPPTIAYGARIIGVKRARGNTETPYTTRAWRNDRGSTGRRRVDKWQRSAALLRRLQPPQDL
jgi:hypothetical protein